MIDFLKPRMEKTVRPKKKSDFNLVKTRPSINLNFEKKSVKKRKSKPIKTKKKENGNVEVEQSEVPLSEDSVITETKRINAKRKKHYKSGEKPVKISIGNKQLKTILMQECHFISDVLKMMPVERHSNDEGEDSDVYMGGGKEVEEESGNPPLPGPQAVSKRAQNLSKRAQSLAELHERLQSKLAEFKGKQPDYEDKKKRRCIKKKLSKVNKKKRKNEERKLKKTVQTVSKHQEQTAVTLVAKTKKPIFNAEGQMVFSKFDFSESGSQEKNVKKQDPKRLLKNLQKDKEKIGELVSAGEINKASHLIEKKSWKSALQKAEGLKVKDDPELVKKSINKVQQKKKHSAKKWKERTENVQKKLEDKQKKRKDNILSKKQDKKDKKIKKLVKKGRIVPGF